MTGFVEAAALPYLGIQMGELSLDEKAEILFLDQAYDFFLLSKEFLMHFSVFSFTEV